MDKRKGKKKCHYQSISNDVENSELMLLAGTSHEEFAEGVSRYLKVPLAEREITRRECGEIEVRLRESTRYVFFFESFLIDDFAAEKMFLLFSLQ
jgi:phosphoribosylpyrophosphate synthetase